MYHENIYDSQFEWINIYKEENNYISDIQYNLLQNINSKIRLHNCKKFVYYKEDFKNNWVLYNYYLSPIFILYYPDKLIPYINWKINNIKQRI